VTVAATPALPNVIAIQGGLAGDGRARGLGEDQRRRRAVADLGWDGDEHRRQLGRALIGVRERRIGVALRGSPPNMTLTAGQ
jgi:hypothetical protein